MQRQPTSEDCPVGMNDAIEVISIAVLLDHGGLAGLPLPATGAVPMVTMRGHGGKCSYDNLATAAQQQ
jgi:hypothetical protein